MDLRESSLRMRRNDMQPNRVWIAVLLVMFFAVPLTITVDAQEKGAPDDAVSRRADELLKKLTLDEKLQLILSKYPSNASPGGGGGYIEGVTRLHIPDINMSDSSTGSGSTTQPSSTFPATIALAASWDRQLSYDYGGEVAIQLRAQGFAMGLGGGANLTREPRGGRSFEYLGEDPLLAGELLAERTKGTQSQKVMASIKHFAGNEQETNRMGGDSHIDDRTLRELYLLPFEIAVEQGHPASVMCSYNRLNGDYACENSALLTNILKTQWQFPGQVQSDWGATHTTAKAINAGLDEEEGSDAGPSYFGRVPVLFALANHDITQERVDDMVRRKLYSMIASGVMDYPPHGGEKIDFDAARTFAQSVEEQSIVLLKNDRRQLPLSTSNLKHIAVIGSHANVAVMSGGGSADTMHPVTGSFPGCEGLEFVDHNGCGWWRNPWLKVPVPLTKAIRELSPASEVEFSGVQDEQAPFRAYSPGEIADAVALARRSDIAIVVVAQPAGEDFGDLRTLSLQNPSNQNELVDAVANANPHTIVVVQSGNPILMPWKDKVAAIVEAWYPGEAGGRAIGNVLFGKVDPSGKLPFTFPARDEDTPTWGATGAVSKDPVYSEKLNIGYRWYDAKKLAPLFEFGYGLSYTNFTYSDLSLKRDPDHTLHVSFTVKNDGTVEGAEVPQVYLGIDYAGEPPLRLGGWSKVRLKPGESQQVDITVSPRTQSVWDTSASDWRYIPDAVAYVGSSSRDIRLKER
ncbi:glycoside hydrolase family 3 protein [Granulicella sp. S190]|uniref:beta-glucosidase n=1 Tax=Granulicella sp. S190 TaxID=1747226 RepID=UPI0020B1713E|nr:glycoside hydrolase family 3 C-terminal domain-containing protein [Granulicella sp. S190]